MERQRSRGGFHDATPSSTLTIVKRTDTSAWPCTIARSAAVLGDHWNLLLVRQACLGTRRFDDFQQALGIGRNILTVRLNRLVDEGLLHRVEYQQNPPRHEYRLTQQGREVYPILAAMAAWGDRWLTGADGTPLVLHHKTCDHDMHAVVVCSECETPIDVRDVRARAGPGYHPATHAGATT
jgi:DNA-binding HxlR family transcriptional regulator